MKKVLFILLLLCPLGGYADLLDDIVTGKYAPESLPGMVGMPEGDRYARLVGGDILAYSYKTGQIVDTLFSREKTQSLKLDTVEGFLLSPTDRWLLVYTNAKKIYRRSFEADWYIYDRRRNQLKPLSESMPVQEPQFSPDGNYVAFARENNLYVHKLLFGTEVAVTTDGQVGTIINGISDWLYEEEFSVTCLYAFSPDSKQLAFVRLDETDVPAFSWQTFLPRDGEPLNEYPQNHSLKYPRAGTKNAIPSVRIYDMYYKSVKTMDIGVETDIYVPRISWTASSDALAVFRLNRNQNKLEMLSVNPKSTVSQLCYVEENKDGYIDFEQIDDWQFLSDNRFLCVNETDGRRHVYLYAANGQKIRQLTKGDYDITAVYGYDETAQMLYYQAAPTPLTRKVYALDVRRNRVQELTPEEGFHQAYFSSDCSFFVDNYSSITTPARASVMDNHGRRLRDLYDNKSLADKWNALQLPQKNFFTLVNERGDTLNGWMLLPKDFDKKHRYPALQVQYSGPGSQQVLNRWRIDWEYALAAEGIVVVCVDGRGTGGRGRRFCQQTYMNLGQMEAEDQVSVARWLQQQSYIDSDRLAIWGWSYGGFMTLMSMSQPEAPFCCGISVAPVTDFRLYDSAYTERFMRRPQANESGYDACSLPTMADRLQGRVLLVHGIADDNVHCQNMWLYIDSLIKAGKQFDMQIYPDDDHFLRKRSNYQHLYRRKMDFLRKHLLEGSK